jgi:hypothetical protein
MHLYKLSGQGKSQASAFRLSRLGAGLLEFKEYSLVVFCGYTRPRIAHFDAHKPIIAKRSYPDLSLPRRKLNRITYQVEEDLFNARGIDVKRSNVAGVFRVERYTLFRRERADCRINRFENALQRHRAHLQLHLASFDLGKIENLIDEI